MVEPRQNPTEGRPLDAFPPDPEAIRRREAVIRRFPDIAVDILRPGIAELIGSGQPWEDAFLAVVAEESGVAAVPRSLLAYLDGNRLLSGGIHHLARLAGRIPAHWLPHPGDRSEVSAFLDIAGSLAYGLGSAAESRYETLFSQCDGRWRSWREQLADCISPVVAFIEAGDSGSLAPTLYPGLRGADRVVSAFANQVVIPLMIRDLGSDLQEAVGCGYAAAQSLVLGHVGLESYLRMTRHLEFDGVGFESALYERLSDADAPRWPGLIAQSPLVDGVDAVPLTSAYDVLDEAREGMNLDGSWGLGHAAAGLIARCRSGREHVVSLREAHSVPPVRLATVSLRYAFGSVMIGCPYELHDDVPCIATPWPGLVLEARLFESDVPFTARTIAAFDRLVAGVGGNRIRLKVPPSREMAAEGRERASGRGSYADENWEEVLDVDELAGYPVDVPRALEAALEAWRPYLPVHVSRMALDEIADAVKPWVSAKVKTAAHPDGDGDSASPSPT